MTTPKRPANKAPSKRLSKKPSITKLCLFVAGGSPRSERARTNLSLALEAPPAAGRDHQVEMIDVFKEPHRAVERGIMATPALVIDGHPDSGVVVGDLSNTPALAAFLRTAFSR